MKKILVAVTGGISAYKSVDVISALKKLGYHVSVMATENALQFVSENTLQITADRYWKHTWSSPVHIDATNPEEIDAFVVVPSTANIIAKIANGISDDLVSSTVTALPPNVIKILCPAMNSRMITNDIVVRNMKTLREMEWNILSPVSGILACGTEGFGKLPPTKEIVEFVKGKIPNEKNN